MSRIVGARITLREVREEDISGMRAWRVNPESIRCRGGTSLMPESWEETENILRRYLSGDAGGANWVIAEKESLRYLGQVSLIMLDQLNRRAELTIVLAPEEMGKGYATEAIRLVLGFAFRSLNLNRVWLKVAENNARAIKCYLGCGFREEGRLRQELFLDGRYVDALVMGFLREEYMEA